MRVDQAAGGTNRHGVPAAAFAMPPGMRMRYDLPAATLADWVSGYAIYIADNPAPLVSWYLPAPPFISILMDAGPVDVTVRNRAHPRVDQASLYGATMNAFRTVTHGGISVGIGLTALGWAALTGRSAAVHLNRIVPLADAIDPCAVVRIVDALEVLDDDARIAPLLDTMLPALFEARRAPRPLVGEMERAMSDGDAAGVEDLATMLGTDVRALRTLSLRYFGMPTKKLLSRARFIRSYAGWMMRGEPPSYAGIDASYFDAAHFLRDARTYLGTTPLRFTRSETVFLRASLRARAAVIGAPAHTLHVRP